MNLNDDPRSEIDKAAELSLRERIKNGPPLPGPGSTYEQGFRAGAEWVLQAALDDARERLDRANKS